MRVLLLADGAFRLVLPLLLFAAVFNQASVFNRDLSSWDVSNVTAMNRSKCKVAFQS
jgi:surface protein